MLRLSAASANVSFSLLCKVNFVLNSLFQTFLSSTFLSRFCFLSRLPCIPSFVSGTSPTLLHLGKITFSRGRVQCLWMIQPEMQQLLDITEQRLLVTSSHLPDYTILSAFVCTPGKSLSTWPTYIQIYCLPIKGICHFCQSFLRYTCIHLCQSDQPATFWSLDRGNDAVSLFYEESEGDKTVINREVVKVKISVLLSVK